ncbi:hypothetical protein O181_089073 [Austropuccinia psidii MF-1]|uniref:Integrase catalytic domain-containing protein n=1 Tax=Austropuccinia psidii MF-1 TaxID=1389203 RepID=A0A9Q3IST5_9BASI|nr:hypothetical protein [Austropuccinia psidii MF-1]
MDWVTELPLSSQKRYNSYLGIVDSYRKTPIFLPCNRDVTAMDTDLLLWNRVISSTRLFKNIISDRDHNLISSFLNNLHRFFGTKLSFYKAYHPQAGGLDKRMVQALGDIIRRLCAYGLESEYSYFFTHDWCTLIPELELEYRTAFHSSTGQLLLY